MTIIEFSDYECPFCKRVEPTVQQVLKTYGDKVRFVYRNFPLPFHQRARPPPRPPRCADEQGKFWEYHDKLMAGRRSCRPTTSRSWPARSASTATKFDECVAARTQFKDAIDKDVAAGEAAGVNGTPAFFINGRMLDGAQPFEKFKEIIDEELASAAQKS